MSQPKLYRVKFWEFPEAGEPGQHKYQLVRLTDDDVKKWREAIRQGCGGEVVEIVKPYEAKEGPWRIVA